MLFAVEPLLQRNDTGKLDVENELTKPKPSQLVCEELLIARKLIDLLDEYIPVVEGSPLNDDPLQPISHYAKNIILKKKDSTPITWMHRSDRFTEKLATPDVTVPDLIGDIDPIKAANLKLSFSDFKVINYGLIPRSNRCIFVINEIPDLIRNGVIEHALVVSAFYFYNLYLSNDKN